MDIRIQDLDYFYGASHILKKINLHIERAEVCALVGPTGAGKTTLLRLIDLLDRPNGGAIYFGERGVAASSRAKLQMRRKMSMVFQKPILFNATVFENVAYPLKLRGKTGKAMRQRVMEVLELVSMQRYEKTNARKLSGGETQRIALARAIACGPEVLLLDEPTANLDPLSVEVVENLIMRINQNEKTTVVMSTHNMLQGRHLADKIAVLMRGELIQSGQASAIFQTPESEEVARFVGVENIVRGNVVSSNEGITCIDVGGQIIEGISRCPVGEKVHVCIQAENVTLFHTRPASSARNFFAGTITLVASSGPLARVELVCPFPLIAIVTKKSAEDMELAIGKKVYASVKATALHIIG